MSKPYDHANPDHMDSAIESVDDSSEIYAHRDYFRGLVAKGHGKEFDYAKQPVIEKALGSTKEIGEYNDMPVFSHGKDVDKFYITNGEVSPDTREHGWFKDGEATTAP